MKWYQRAADYGFVYIVAWLLIVLSPVWLPVWLAIKIYKFPKEDD